MARTVVAALGRAQSFSALKRPLASAKERRGRRAGWPRQHPAEEVLKTIQPASRIHIPYARRDGRSANHQDTHPDDHDVPVNTSRRHADTEVLLPY
jgi:hypothetical protein